MTAITTTESRKRIIQVYFLAAPEDQAVCQDITKHLKPIINSCSIPIKVDGDFNIPSGADIEEYKQRLYDADIVIALLSVDFIDNDDIESRSQKVIDRYNNGKSVIIPILVRNFMWKSTPFRRMTVLPKNFQPLNNKQFWNSTDDAVMAVVTEIYDSINELAQTQIETMHQMSVANGGSTPDIKVAAESPVSETDPNDSINELAQTQTEDVLTTPPAEVERAPDLVADLETPISQPTRQVKESSPIDVDWRRKYYRKVAIKRAGAILLDHIIILGAIFIFINTLWYLEIFPIDSDIWFSLILYFVIMPIMESSKWQGTIGKRILKLQITDKDGERITFLRAFWRNIMRTVMLYLYFVTFGILLIIQYFRFNKTKKLFHDELSGTVIGERLASSSEAQVVAKAA